MKRKAEARCPCGSGNALEDCCARWHRTLQAPTAEALMRSRYSAYVLENEPYLLATWHPATRPASAGLEAGTRWLGLTVKDARALGPDEAEVTFVARYRIGGNPAVRLEERSRFVREQGHWFYVDGRQ
ncbi:MAG TPA: YchJ family metal-binding protein [Nevskia sp.]|nr:YchJ family metal-binding protein [Nevskia sp.]